MFIIIWFSPLWWSFGFKCTLSYQTTNKSIFILETLNLKVNLSDVTNIFHQPIQTIKHSTFHILTNFKLSIIVQYEIQIITCNMQWPMQLVAPFMIDDLTKRSIICKIKINKLISKSKAYNLQINYKIQYKCKGVSYDYLLLTPLERFWILSLTISISL